MRNRWVAIVFSWMFIIGITGCYENPVATLPVQSTAVEWLQTQASENAEYPECQTDKDLSVDLKEGNVVLFFNRADELYVLQKGEPLRRSKLSGPDLGMVMGFSPSGQKFAKISFLSDAPKGIDSFDLLIVNSSGEELKKTVDIRQYQDLIEDDNHRFVGVSYFSEWINEDLMGISLYSMNVNPDATTSRKIFDYHKIFRLSTSNWEDHWRDLEDLDYYGAMAELSPDLSRAIYEGNKGVALWDYNENRVKGSGYFDRPGWMLIDWDADSAKAAFTTHLVGETLFKILSRDGEILADVPTDKAGGQILEMQWAPDDEQLLIVHSKAVEGKATVSVYDFNDRSFKFRCKVPMPTDPAPGVWAAWSPDSSQFILSARDIGTYIFDASQGNMNELLGYGIIRGWSHEFLNFP